MMEYTAYYQRRIVEDFVQGASMTNLAIYWSVPVEQIEAVIREAMKGKP